MKTAKISNNKPPVSGMSGYGQARVDSKHFGVRAQARSLNHKYLDCSIFLPENLRQLEQMLRTTVKKKIKRGKVNISVEVEYFHPAEPIVQAEAVRSYVKLAKDTQKRFGIAPDLTFWHLISLPDVLLRKKPVVGAGSEKQLVTKVVNKALEKLILMRKSEGAAIARDILMRVSMIKRKLDFIQRTLPKLIQQARQKLSNDELASFIKTTDVSEEMVRLIFHLENLRRGIQEAAAEPVGKELDFICQELQREANTLGAKCSDEHVSWAVVKIKSQLEKIREQVQNVE